MPENPSLNELVPKISVNRHVYYTEKYATSKTSTLNQKILYLHGRPAPHKLHGRFAASIGSTFHYVDEKMRWQDKKRSLAYQIISWFLNAFSYPKKYDYYLIDNLHLSPVIMKKLRLISKDKKIIAHMGSHTLYFMHSNWFSPLVNRLHRFMLRNYDFLLCEGKMAQELVKDILGEKAPNTIYTFLGPPVERMKRLKAIIPDTSSKELLHISSGPDGFRVHYKGIFEMVKAFGIAHKSDPSLSFKIIGDWSLEVKDKSFNMLEVHQRPNLEFIGIVDNIEDYLTKSGLYLHCSNGDAFPTATVEAMTSGIVPLVSNWTGTKQIVEEIDSNLVSPMEAVTIADRILWYFQLQPQEKERLSKIARKVSENYTEENSIKHYQKVFRDLANDQ